MKTVVPTSHTRLLAARMVDAVTECMTPADVTIDLLPQCRAGQEVALVAAILDHATNHNTATSSDNNADHIAAQVRAQLAREGACVDDVDE